MRYKNVCLIINPRDGQNMVKINDVLAVFSAAGWKTDMLLKIYCGQTMDLATQAAKKGYDLMVSYGGDGTMNQVINGVKNVKGKSVVGLLPGGTANEWAGEVQIPGDPIKAALALVKSEVREVDLGHVTVQRIIKTGAIEDAQKQTKGKAKRNKEQDSTKAPHNFLMMAGLGIDAAVIGQTPNSLKHKIGPIAFDISSAKEVVEHQPFQLEIRDGKKEDHILWQGEALQVIVANTRRYANMVEVAPDAYLDDSVFDVCVITKGNPLTTMQQISAMLLRHRLDDEDQNIRRFRGAHFSIRVPASTPLQLDGSRVRLKDYLGKAERKVLEQEDSKDLVVDYRFDALPRAIQLAIPHTYDNALFEDKHHEDTAIVHPTGGDKGDQQQQGKGERLSRSDEGSAPIPGDAEALLDGARSVSVVGGVANVNKKKVGIIAGNTTKQSTGEKLPVAVRSDQKTVIVNKAGEHVSQAVVEKLPEGEVIVVKGKKSKRGVIQATHILV
ncbi:MAG: YegS/Rv2252/BmrU family lipid kinase [Chloroflexi bacterium]|nr:MAG: YegS/Rv2252/BmrU family lipid kinase [Chloroflexota bacterium]